MKLLVSLLAFLSISIGFSQTNTINYKALIKDNNGNIVASQNIDIRFTIIANTGPTDVYQETHTGATTDANGIVIVNIGEGTPNLNLYADINWGSDAHSLKVEIDIEQDASFVDLGTTPFLSVPYALHAQNVNGLEKITENGKTGWRLIGRNPDNYGDIGANAIDFSAGSGASSTRGATGQQSFATGRITTASGIRSTAMGDNTAASDDGSTAMGGNTVASGAYSTAMGYYTEASGHYSTAMGQRTEASGVSSTAMGGNGTASGSYSMVNGLAASASGLASTSMGHLTIAKSYAETAIGAYNTDYTPNSIDSFNASDRIFVIGNGTITARSNALTVLKNGTITAPSFSTAQIDAAGNRALITKEYANANYTDTGVAPTGLEQLTENGQTGWRLIGRTAANFGDIGINAVDFSTGSNASTTRGATGLRAFASGNLTTASGNNSFSAGLSSQALGNHSAAFGNGTIAGATATFVIGRYNLGAGTPDSWESSEAVFEIGNGTSDASRANAFTVLKNGNATLAGTLTQNSDRRLKTEITTLNYGLNEILQLNPVSYYWKKDRDTQNQKSIGLIAQDVQPLLKELVREAQDKDKTLSVNYSGLVPVLIKALKEQQEQIEMLKKENQLKDDKNKTLEARLEKVEQILSSMSN